MRSIPCGDRGELDAEVDQHPLLALRGLGKELWEELGGGENFLRELRQNWE